MKKILTGIIILTLLLLNHSLELHANNQNEKVSALEYQFTASEKKVLFRIKRVLAEFDNIGLAKIANKVSLLEEEYKANKKIMSMLRDIASHITDLQFERLTKDIDDVFIEMKKEVMKDVTADFVEWKEKKSEICALRGDINGDGEVNRKDTKLLSKIIINEEEKNSCSDVNGDGKLTVKDIVLVASIESATDGDGKITVNLSDDQGEYQVSQEGNMCVVKNNYTADCSCPENYESTGGIAFGDGPRMYVCYKDLY